MLHGVKVQHVFLSDVTSDQHWEFSAPKPFHRDIFRNILWTSFPSLLLMSVTGESNPIHRLLLWNEKLASFTARDQMHLSLSVLICKRLKGALSPGSSASFHAWFTLICLIGHKDLEMAHLSVGKCSDFSLALLCGGFWLFCPVPRFHSSISISLPLTLLLSLLLFSPFASFFLWRGDWVEGVDPAQQSVWVHLDSN